MDFRLAIICMAAASVGLSMALISISKLLLMLCGLAVLLLALRKPRPDHPLAGMHAPAVILVSLAALTLSLLWTTAPQADAVPSIAKYGKLLFIPLLVLLIRTKREALYAMAAFAATQVFLVLSAWALYAHLPVPWATSNMALKEYAVFSSYLDQGIISATFALVCWHLRSLVPGRHGRRLAVLAGLLALGSVFFVLSGRSGHAVAIALLSLAIMWEMPPRLRPLVIVMPFALAMVLFFSSSKVQSRLTAMSDEIQTFSTETVSDTSSGIRLNLWRRALQSLAEHPAAGSGVGSWSTEFNRLERQQNPSHRDIPGNGNPHQEYLLWGMQLGIPGLLLIAMLMLALWADSWRMQTPCARATQTVLLAMAVACLFNSSIYDALIGDFFCILLGLLYALGHVMGPKSPAGATPPTPQPLPA